MTDSKTLVSDPTRDATFSIAGYAYQIAQSILAWLEMDDNDLLILEGAEDFDIHKPQETIATQIKGKVGNVTLNSDGVTDAINNFWAAKIANPNINLYLRYLTTENSTREKKSLPSGKKGIDVWNHSKTDDSDATEIRNFLLESKNIDSSLKAEILKWSDDELKNNLLKRIFWDLGAKEKNDLEKQIEKHLIIHGQNKGVAYEDSLQVLSSLVKHTIDMLSTPGIKKLDKIDFYKIFDASTTVTVSKSSLILQNPQIIENIFGDLLSKTLDSVGHLTITSVNPVAITKPIPIPDFVAKREKLVDEYCNIALKASSLVLIGSTGMGKSYLAALVCQKQAVEWSWLGFRGEPPQAIRKLLIETESEVSIRTRSAYVVIDDFQAKGDAAALEALSILAKSISLLNGILIVTTEEKYQAYDNLSSPSNNHVITVPTLSEADISELLQINGLEDSTQYKTIAKLIWLNTQGHPQLIHAKIKNLKSKNWKTNLVDLFDSTDLKLVKKDANSRLINDFTSQETRSLAYRLSLLNGSFMRDTALAIADASPSLNLPGEHFNELLGPWIEELDEDEFRLSPLLSNAAQEIFSTLEIQDLHCKILNGLLSLPSLGPRNFTRGIFHAYMGGDNLRLMELLNQFVTNSDIKRSKYITNNLQWLSLCDPNNPPTEWKIVELPMQIRLTQFILLKDDVPVEEVEDAIANIESAADKIPDEGLALMLKGISYSMVLMNLNVSISLITAIRLICKLFPIVDQDIQGTSINSLIPKQPKTDDNPSLADVDLIQAMFATTASHISGTEDFAHLIQELDKLPDEQRNHLLSIEKYDNGFIKTLVGRAWFADEKNQTLDINASISIFEYADNTAQKWDCIEISIESIIAISVLQNEYSNELNKALETVEDGLSRYPNSSGLQYQKSKVLFNLKENQKALLIAENLLSKKLLNNIDAIFCSRDAGIAAAKLNDWAKVEKLFLSSVYSSEKHFKPESTMNSIAIGLKADAAFAIWKQKRFSDALQLWMEILDELPPSNEISDIQDHHLHATIRHLILWMHSTNGLRNEELADEPYPGMCSNSSPNQDIVNQKLAHICLTWDLLLDIDERLNLGIGIAKKITAKNFIERPLLSFGFNATQKLDRIYKKKDFSFLIPAIIEEVETTKYIKSIPEDNLQGLITSIPKLPENYWDKEEGQQKLISHMFNATVICTENFKDAPFALWKKHINEICGTSDQIESFLGIYDGALPVTQHEKVIQWLINLYSKQITLEDQWIYNTLLHQILAAGDRSHINKTILNITNKVWQRSINNQKIEFINPQIGIPKIQASLDAENTNEFYKASKILLATMDHINLNISPKYRTYFSRFVPSS